MKDIVVSIVCMIVSGFGTFWLTKLGSTYIIAGVAAERGYTAVGGEVLYCALIFLLVYYAVYHLLKSLVNNLINTLTSADD